MATSESIARVLAGQACYDELDGVAQAAVRRAWDEQLADDVARLDLPAHLRAAGLPWAQADEDGNVIWRDPGPAAPAR